MQHFNGLTPAEAERLALVMEEMAEAQQVIGKILRHGFDSRHPNGGATNRQLLEMEIGDVMAAIDRMTEADLNAGAIASQAKRKRETSGRYLHHQGAAEAVSK